jgi:transposase
MPNNTLTILAYLFPSRAPLENAKRHPAPSRVAHIIALRKEGLTFAEIAERVGVKKHTAYIWFRQYATDDDKAAAALVAPKRGRRRTVSPERVGQIIALRKEGLTFAEIAERVGVTLQTAHSYFRQYATDDDKAAAALVAPKRGRPGPENPERTAQIVALRKKGLTLQEIGTQFGITREAVRKQCLRYGDAEQDAAE